MFVTGNKKLPKILCVLVLISSMAIPLVKAINPVEIYGYIHLDDGEEITQLSNQQITIRDDYTQTVQQVYTDQYGFYHTVLPEPHGQLGIDTLTIDASYYDPVTHDLICSSTVMTLSPYMRADPTFITLEQECDWYEDENAPISSFSPHSDEIVISLYYSQEFVFEGEPVTIYADIKNVGDSNLIQTTNARFYDGEDMIYPGDIAIQGIPQGETVTVQIIWLPGCTGTHEVTAVVAEAKQFPEVNMGNNARKGNYVILTYWGDYDLDGLLNWDEYAIYGTDPLDADTDGDGLPDGWEHFNGLSPLNDGRIDPIHGPNGDQDGDGLINKLEYSNSFDTDGNPSSDPWNPDTDGDGFTDFEEVSGVLVSGGQTSWFEGFEDINDLDWNVVRSDQNNLFGLEIDRYISSPFSMYLETETMGYAFGTSPNLDIDYGSDYCISFYFRLGEATNQWIEVVNNGQIKLAVDASNNLCHMNGGNPTIIEPLLPHKWYYIQCDVDASLSNYEVKIDSLSEKTGISFNDPVGYSYLRFGSLENQASIGKAYWDDIFIQYSTPAKSVQIDPSTTDTDMDNLNDFDEINTYGLNPSDYDTDDDSFMPYFDFNDGIEVQYWVNKGYSPAEAGAKAKNRSVDLDQVSDGFEVFAGFDPEVYEHSNVKWKHDGNEWLHLVWQEENSPYEIYYKNNIDCTVGWNSEIQLTDTPNQAISVQPRLSLTDTKIHIEWMEVNLVGATWNGKWCGADTAISKNYQGNWNFMEFYRYICDESDKYAVVYPIPNPANSEVVFPEPFPYFVGINPGDFTDNWEITPIDMDEVTIIWHPEPIPWPISDNLDLITPRIDEIIKRIKNFDPGYDDGTWVYVGPGPGTVIYAFLDLWLEWGGYFRAVASGISVQIPPINIEITFGYDSDGDGLTDNQEDVWFNTDKYDPDTDDDNYFSFYYDTSHPYLNFSDGDEKYYWNTEFYEGFWNNNFDGDSDGYNNLKDPDSDNDEMGDGWELYYNFKPYDNGDVNYKGEPVEADKGPDADFDGDGLNNKFEYNLNDAGAYDIDGDQDTDPTDTDTDNDGLSDGEEVYLGLDNYKTDPTAADTDNDGLNDGDEVNLYMTSPLNPDSDNDGLNDGDEVSMGLDPNNDDYDHDNLKDGEEVNGWDILVNYQTRHVSSNPKTPHSDGDGVNDYDEKYITFTDPKDTDTDDDGIENNELTDGEEISFGTIGYLSSSDIDSLKDGEEIYGIYVENLGKTVYSNPSIPDSDTDGLYDDIEVKGVWLPNLGRKVYSDPKDTTTDGDSLSDGDEVNIYKIDPNDMDSDEDGLDDDNELDYWNTNYGSGYWNNDNDGDGKNNIGDYDSDGDWISDSADTNPIDYNKADGGIFNYNEITVNNTIGVSVAVRYDGSDIQPIKITPQGHSSLGTGIDKQFDVDFENTASSDTFTAIIRVIYSDGDVAVDEDSLVLYYFNENSDTWHLGGVSGVFSDFNVIWTETMHFSRWSIADDGDEGIGDDLIDDWENSVGISKDWANNQAGNHGNTLWIGEPPIIGMDDPEIVIAYENSEFNSDDPILHTFDVSENYGIEEKYILDDYLDTINSNTIEFVAGNFDEDDMDEIVTAWKNQDGEVELNLFDIDNDFKLHLKSTWDNPSDQNIITESKSIKIQTGNFDSNLEDDEIVIAYENGMWPHDYPNDPMVHIFDVSISNGLVEKYWWHGHQDTVDSVTVELAVGNFGDDIYDEIIIAYKNSDMDAELRLLDVNPNNYIISDVDHLEKGESIGSESIIIHTGNFDTTPDDDEVVFAYEETIWYPWDWSKTNDPFIYVVDVNVALGDEAFDAGEPWTEDDTINSNTIEFVTGQFNDQDTQDEIVTVWKNNDWTPDVELRLLDVNADLKPSSVGVWYSSSISDEIEVESTSIMIHTASFNIDDNPNDPNDAELDEIAIAWEDGASGEYPNDPIIQAFDIDGELGGNNAITAGNHWHDNFCVDSYTVEFVTGNFNEDIYDEIVAVWKGDDMDVFVQFLDVDTDCDITSLDGWRYNTNIGSTSVIIQKVDMDDIIVDADFNSDPNEINTFADIPTVFSGTKLIRCASGRWDSLIWKWDVYDNSANLIAELKGQYPVYTFSESGTYTMTVMVTDGLEGDTDTLTVSVTTLTTDPNLLDTDGDGLWDGDEYYGDTSNPAGGGWDGTNNIHNYVTNPRSDDTDGDGLKDGQELLIGTNPLDPDSDDDNMFDGFELNIFGTSPLIENNQYSILMQTQLDWYEAFSGVRLLTQRYRYDIDNEIRLLLDVEGTKSNFQTAIQEVANIADTNDIVYIVFGAHGRADNGGEMAFNDGGGDSHSDWTKYSIVDDWLDTINCLRLIIIVQTCYGGSAVDDFADGDNPCSRIIYTAGDETEIVNCEFTRMFHYASGDDMDMEPLYTGDDAFNTADVNGNGYVSVRESYNFACTQLPNYSPQEGGDTNLGDHTYVGEYR